MAHSHVSWSARVNAVPLHETEASEESASSGEKGSHAGNLEKQDKKYCYYHYTIQFNTKFA